MDLDGFGFRRGEKMSSFYGFSGKVIQKFSTILVRVGFGSLKLRIPISFRYDMTVLNGKAGHQDILIARRA